MNKLFPKSRFAWLLPYSNICAIVRITKSLILMTGIRRLLILTVKYEQNAIYPN